MPLKFAIACFSIIFFISVIKSQCIPLYPRMFYNPESVQINSNKIDLIFMFNTNISCPSSYIQVSYNKTITKVLCRENIIQTLNTDKSIEFMQYVQKCSSNITQNYEIQQFSYKLYACKSMLDCIPYSPQEIPVQMPVSKKPVRFVNLADWGPLTHESYAPINKTLDYMLEKRRVQRMEGTSDDWRISGMIMEGDFAYNFETNHCGNYVLFMNELTRVSRYWPMMPNAGNHESPHPKSMYLFESSFVIGRISTADGIFKRVQTYRLPNRFTLINYDPFSQIYGKHPAELYKQMLDEIRQQLLRARRQHPQEFVIVGSHYPIKCSQEKDFHCIDTLKKIPEVFDFLSTPFEGKGLVDLYLGAHMHQYQRLWPYVSNAFVNESSPFYRGRMVNIVEGVAGNPQNLVDQITPQIYSAAHTVGVTGLGIISFEGNSQDTRSPFIIRYRHATSNNTFEISDQFVITNQYEPASNLMKQ